MKLSDKGAAFVRAHEGFVPRYYLDPVGVPTIGVGFTWRSAAFREWWTANRPDKFGIGAAMTREEADDALRTLFDKEYGKAVNDFLDKKVPQHVFDGMASPVYNLGPGALKWKWAAAAKAGNYAEAAKLLRTTGTTAQGKKLAGLVRRRQEEALLIEKGIYTGIAEPIDAMSDGVLRRGERGPAVAQLIRDLHKLGHYDGALDDVFGPGTESAVMSFQRTHDLDADGKAGPVTLAKIAALMAPPAPVAPAPAPVQPEPFLPAPAPAVGLWASIIAALTRLFSKGA